MVDGGKGSEEGEAGANEIILEIRAGAGGDEAALFARDLGNMYSAYARNEGWSVTEIDAFVYEIRGKGVYEDLRFETGVHRIQRVPATEKSGRVHTSSYCIPYSRALPSCKEERDGD